MGYSIINHAPTPPKRVQYKNYLDHVYAVSDDSGDILEHYRYTAFGEVSIYDENGAQVATTQIDNHILWNTRRRDELTGYYMYKFRHYSAELGRWLARDSIAEWGGVNLYAYVGNNSISRWDWLGLSQHHWFLAKHATKGGQAQFNAKCPKLVGFDINDFTTQMDGSAEAGGFYKTIPHGYIHHVLKYNAIHDAIYKGSVDCCHYLMSINALRFAMHTLLRKNNGKYTHGTSYDLSNPDLVSYNTGINNNAKFDSYISLACSRTKRCEDKKGFQQAALQAELYVQLQIQSINLTAEIEMLDDAIDENIKTIGGIDKNIEDIQANDKIATAVGSIAIIYLSKGRIRKIPNAVPQGTPSNVIPFPNKNVIPFPKSVKPPIAK